MTTAAEITAERWTPVSDYEGYYEVSDQGRMRGIDRVVIRCDGQRKTVQGQPLTLVLGSQGYFQVTLNRDGRKRTVRVHRVVLEAFYGPPEPGQESCHGPAGRSKTG